MKHDNFILQCPACNETFPVCINSRFCVGVTYGMENAPLFAVGEVNEWSKRDAIKCIDCGVSVYLEVCYAVKTRLLSDRIREEFNENKDWIIG